MQKKVGIRLRHLESNQGNKVIANNEEKYAEVNRKRERERSTSPMSRRKIFGKAQVESNQQVKSVLQQYQNKTKNEITKQNKIPSNQYRQQPSSSNIPTNDNYQYESQVQRLIESLKKKTLESQKKQQIIKKLTKQIEQLKFENGRYLQDIKQLKSQLEIQRSQKQKSNIAYIGQKQKYDSSKSNISQNNLTSNKNVINSNWKSTNLYENQPYQQFVQEQKQHNLKQQLGRIKEIQYEHLKDSSKYEQFLSPLMVFNSQKPKPPSYSQSQRLQTFSNQEKSNSRISCGPNLYKQQQQRQNTDLSNHYPPQQGFINSMRQRNDNPFQRKILIQQTASPLRTLESTGKFDIGGGEARRQQKHWGTYESQIPYFRRREQVSPMVKVRKQNQERSEKYLEIEDSKNFKFQDFEFDDFDPSTY